ncbi:metallophosphatase [Pseudoalteromonas phenolica]|uniref:alkaline phosphatase D family protein n=1 Tax=Pseudoalteromonas phenolica TaxID=161398 RepID=UPI00110AA33C|nr:alkaline phosphatase D family protein [Pseudoalteromonas phenolica]TMN87370.1 metallophosphatase [Pseudoalteromonas phenolica]
MKLRTFLTASLISIGGLVTQVHAADQVDKILFGSCSHQDKDIPIFDAINKEQADLFVFLGDNVYGDTENMTVLKSKYHKLGIKPGFAQLRANTPVIAMWDDHDYGENDAGKEYPFKEASRKIMLDFWQEPKDSPRRTRDSGIYTSYMYGEEAQRVQVIMPDLRWNRPALSSIGEFRYWLNSFFNNVGPYRPVDESISMLGEAQWQWLEQELLKPAKIKVISSSLQLIPDFTGWESWANFPADRQRLFDFIEKHKIGGVIMISGDTHWGELSKYQVKQNYPLWEVTSSGLTQKWKDVSPNKHRVGESTSDVNYGFIEIDWQQADPNIEFGLKDINGDVTHKQSMPLSALQFK